jgi:hypothetical protein
MIRPSRGDRKACTEPDCCGTMQFGRRTAGARSMAAPEQVWSCDVSTHTGAPAPAVPAATDAPPDSSQ